MGYIATKKKSLEEFLKRNHKFALPAILVGGFMVDTLTLGQADRVFDNVVLIIHLFIVGTTIALLFSVDSPRGRKLKVKERTSTITALMLFSFGGLFSGFAVFYAKSGSLISSWPFILLMLLVMVGTEIRKKYFEKTLLQIGIFYIALFSYLIFSIPVLVKKIGTDIYMLSGLASLFLIFLYTLLLSSMNKEGLKKKRKKIFVRIASIFLVFNALYFLNIIPPIPLALKFRAVYHDFYRIQTIEYRGKYELPPTWEFWKKHSHIFHRASGEPVYVYSEVYAPVNLSTDIYHEWQYFDASKTRWVTVDRIRIPITGGRAEGFRGFSKKVNVWNGSWRVKVTTARGQTLGQLNFKIKDALGPLETREEVFR